MSLPQPADSPQPATDSPQPAARLLVVDDEAGMRRALRAILATRGYDVRLVPTGEDALRAAAESRHEMIILDLGLPDMDGIEVCARLRKWTSVPILILSVRSSERDKIAALDLGADDYLSKPFSAGELLARVRALLRRSAGQSQQTPLVRSGDLEVDLARRAVRLSGEDVLLTPIEYDVLSYLAQNANCVVRRGEIARRVWGRAGSEEAEALRVHVSHIRRKIENASDDRRFILTEPGVGYRFLAAE